MKKLTSVLLTAALFVAAGCNQGTPGGNTTTPDSSTTGTGMNGTNDTTTSTGSSDFGSNSTTSSTDSDSSTGSDTGTHSVSKPLIGEKEQTFSLDMPNLGTTIKQGETQNITIGIDRGDNFDEDVTLSLTNVPQGVTVTPQEPVLKKGEEEIVLAVAAAADAALGDFTIDVSGSPSGGGTAATNKLEVSVKEK